jgi:hypothetical protein
MGHHAPYSSDSIAPSDLGDEINTIFAALNQARRNRDNLMSQITDWAAAEQADLTAISNTLTSLVAGIAALDAQIVAQIVAFQNSPGTLSASDQAALTAIQTASAALVTQSAAISVTPPAPPTA